MLDISNDKKDSKVVITTHYPLALKSNYVNRNVKLKKLSPDEAQAMFRDIAGVEHLTPNIQLICKRFCARLPLLIDPIARFFNHQEAPPDWLRDQSEQKCFLYASLYPANSKIYTDFLVECCIAQGFLGDADATTKYSGMRTRAIDTVLRSLVNVAFLEEGEQMRTKISKLPSLKGLTGLKAFYVNGCSRLKICSHGIQPLKHLEVFDIRGAKINFVPYLESLWCLRISYFASSNCDGISKLRELEELTIEVKSLSKWCDDAENIIEEVASLENLTTFRCSFPSSETLGKFLKSRKSRRGKKQFTPCPFFVRSESSQNPKIIESFDDDSISKCVKYCNGDERVDLAITEMLSQVKAFELICHKRVANIDFPKLEKLVVQNCSRIEVLFKVPAEGEQQILPKLKVLVLDSLLNFKFICSSENLAWRSLEKLNVRKCPNLKTLPFNTINVANLKTIEGEEEWWNNIKRTHPMVHEQFASIFSASNLCAFDTRNDHCWCQN
ncbi:uncharacterized protein LOC114721171 [Neltuma alba]|uniref:uncharacterized protein LOC114721171 n=1 Tax=Neltuma alba TaxID=207710 RepID=UPI0010A39933|nr:uncharacterized protein LOC114721171 [Prosopis alba]